MYTENIRKRYIYFLILYRKEYKYIFTLPKLGGHLEKKYLLLLTINVVVMAKRQTYIKEFKLEVVELVDKIGKTAQAERDLGIPNGQTYK